MQKNITQCLYFMGVCGKCSFLKAKFKFIGKKQVEKKHPWQLQFTERIEVHKDYSDCNGGIDISGRADAGYKYFRKKKKFLDYSDHSGYTYEDWKVLIAETAVEESLIDFVSSRAWNIC